jgi:hypothetical protein
MTLYEKPDSSFVTYVEDAQNNSHKVSESDQKTYEAYVSSGEKAMMMRSTLFEKDDEVSRRKAQGYQTWVKGLRKLEKS